MQLKIEASKGLDEGKHTGKTTKLEVRPAKDKSGKVLDYSYAELYIKADDAVTDFEVRYSMPYKPGEKGKLAMTLAAFLGRELKVGETVDPEKILVGRNVSFMVMDEVTAKGTFSRVVDGSLKPLN